MEEANAGGAKASSQDVLEFELEVIANDATEEELDRMARNLLSELQDTDVEPASLVSVGAAPQGNKGDDDPANTPRQGAVTVNGLHTENQINQ